MNFQEKLFRNEYGLSCVEDYILYILCKDTINWPQVFYSSYYDIEEIINYLLFKGQEYSSIKFIERIQNILVKEEILDLVRLDIEAINGIEPYQFFLLELQESATKELLNISVWRSDHYIMCCKDNNGKYMYVNDRPYIAGNLEYSEIQKYAGKEYAFVVYVINKDIGTVINKDKVVQLERKLKSETILSGDLYLGFEKIRDSVGIYRVVVKRLQALFCSYGTSNFIEDEIKRIDNIYLRLEYMNIRKSYDLGKVITLISEAINIQKDVKKKALGRMDIIYEQCR